MSKENNVENKDLNATFGNTMLYEDFFSKGKLNYNNMKALKIIKEVSEFKNKYFTNNFYWVDESNYENLQNIGISLGCLCYTGKMEIIKWHEGFKNIGFRTYERNKGITTFQKEAFLLGGKTATSYEEMIEDYKKLILLIEA